MMVLSERYVILNALIICINLIMEEKGYEMPALQSRNQ